MDGWKRGGGKTRQGHPIQNADLWWKVYDSRQGRRAEAECVKVPSHVDLKGNEEASALADEGVNKQRVRLEADTQKQRRAEKRP